MAGRVAKAKGRTTARAKAKTPPPRREPVVLDDADRRIIELLTADGRASNRSLAAEVGLTEATVAARLRRLVENRVLGVSAIFDWEAAGYGWDLWLAVAVEGSPPRDVAADIAQLPFVHSVSIVFGPFDMVVHVLAPRRDDVVEFLTDRISGIPGVRNYTVDVTLSWVKYAMNSAALPLEPTELSFPAPAVPLDDLDLSAIAALTRDGRQSNREIARQLGVSDGTIRGRLRRLEQAGMVRITAQTDPWRAGMVNSWAFVGIKTEGTNARLLAEKLAGVPEIDFVALTAGRHDLFLHVSAPNRSRLIDLLVNELRGLDGVRSTETWEAVYNIAHDYRWVRLLPPVPARGKKRSRARSAR